MHPSTAQMRENADAIPTGASMSDVSLQTLSDFIKDLGSGEPSPGAGAAGAVALALASGCAAKAFGISHRHQEVPGLDLAARRAATIATIALEGAQRDGEDFRAWLATHSTDAAERLQSHSDVLLSLHQELEHLIQIHGPHVRDTLLADLATARELGAAFRKIATRNQDELQGP